MRKASGARSQYIPLLDTVQWIAIIGIVIPDFPHSGKAGHTRGEILRVMCKRLYLARSKITDCSYLSNRSKTVVAWDLE